MLKEAYSLSIKHLYYVDYSHIRVIHWLIDLLGRQFELTTTIRPKSTVIEACGSVIAITASIPCQGSNST